MGIWCTVCVLNTESTLNVELQFELVDFWTSDFVFCQQITTLNILFDERTTRIITPRVAYGCETWPSRLTDKQRLKVF